MDNTVLGFIKSNRKLWRVCLLVIFGIALVLLSSAVSGSEKESEGEIITLAEYKKALEEELSSVCSSVEGVGKCKVIVTFERGEQNSYKGSTLIESKPPRVLGVTVVCRGAESDFVRRELTGMLTALFDIGSNRVAILKLNS